MASMTLPALPFGTRIGEEEREGLRAEYAAKRAYLGERFANLCVSTNPTSLWNSMVKHRMTDAATGKSSAGAGCGDDDSKGGEAVAESYDDLHLTFEGFCAVAYELLFNTSLESNAKDPLPTQTLRKRLFFSHPFLSPAVFLGFSRSDRDTVPAVPLYAFVAKRLLLFRLRVELELAASVPPPFFRTQPSHQLPCPPSASSPLSNGLAQEDLEAFISDLVPHLRLVRDMPPWMLPYYLCHASRKFFFMCDTRHVGALSIETVMKSDVFSELLRLFESDPRDAFTVYPERCPVEVCSRLVDPGAAADDTTPGTVVAFENDGVEADDLYTVQVAAGFTEDDGEAGRPTATRRESLQTVRVRRDMVYFNSAAVDYLGHEQLNMDNWFSLPLMCRIYEHFTSLDQDADGVLTVEELAHYSNDSFTRLAIERTFECHVPHSSARHIMDYKTYLNFVIATEHAATRPAMKYIWAILDLDGTKSLIKTSTLHCFCKEIANALLEKGMMADISPQSILSEIVDMINPKWHEWITFEDMERSGQQATVLPILLSYRNFFAYDCREQTAAVSSDEYAESTE